MVNSIFSTHFPPILIKRWSNSQEDWLPALRVPLGPPGPCHSEQACWQQLPSACLRGHHEAIQPHLLIDIMLQNCTWKHIFTDYEFGVIFSFPLSHPMESSGTLWLQDWSQWVSHRLALPPPAVSGMQLMLSQLWAESMPSSASLWGASGRDPHQPSFVSPQCGELLIPTICSNWPHSTLVG